MSPNESCAPSLLLAWCFLWHIGTKKAHKTFTHKLCPVSLVTGPPGRVPGQTIYVPWVPKIAHQHLTLGLPVGRQTRGVTGQKDLSVCAFFFPEHSNATWVAPIEIATCALARGQQTLLLLTRQTTGTDLSQQ